jgi:hypothetical protein
LRYERRRNCGISPYQTGYAIYGPKRAPLRFLAIRHNKVQVSGLSYLLRNGRSLLRLGVCLAAGLPLFGQGAPPIPADSPESVRAQLQELRTLLNDLSKQLIASHAENESLRVEVQALRDDVRQLRPVVTATVPAPPPAPPSGIAEVADDQRLLAAKVDEQYQTKVASGSKYQVRLSGMALFSGFTTQGAVDNLDLPETARAIGPGESNGSTGATLRQSMLTLEVFGPRWGGAKASGELKVDFFGGFPSTAEGLTAGLLRLRSARLNLDWQNTSLMVGQDALFFSPRSPTSLVSTAYPAFSSAGNLWTWTPQIYVEHRMALSERSRLTIQGGVLDPLTGELPLTEYDRAPTAGERSRTPAYAARVAVEHQSAAIGVGSYYSRQDWGFGRNVNAWAVTADWDLPLGRWFALSGEFYRGRAIGGLGGGANGSVLFSGAQSLAASQVSPVDSLGGWSQLKFKPGERWQFNAAFGKDSSFGAGFDQSLIAAGLVHRNASGFLNVIFQPRSNLIFSLEYRRLWTSRFWEPLSTAGHLALGAGILF